LEFCHVQRQVLSGNFVEGPDNAALHQRPEALDCLSTHCANHVFAARMIDSGVRVFLAEMLIRNPLVRAEQANVRRDCLADELGQRVSADVFNNAGNNIALALHGSRDDSFASATRAAVPTSALVFVPVLGFAADESFVHFHNAHEFAEIFVREPSADAMAHAPSRAVASRSDHAVDLERGNSLLAGQHEMNHAEPFTKRVFRILKDRADQNREAIGRAVLRAGVALPIKSARPMLANLRIATARAEYAGRPAASGEVGPASIFVRKSRFPLAVRHLVDAFLAGHDRHSFLMGGT
jgi:hypothetical protein